MARSMSVPYPTADYDEHPAFDFPVDASHGDRSEEFAAAMSGLDAALEPLRQSATPLSTRQVGRRTESSLARGLDDARRLMHAGQSEQERAAIDVALREAAAELPAEAAYRSLQFEQRAGATLTNPVALALETTGAHESTLDPGDKAQLIDALQPTMRAIESSTPPDGFFKRLAVIPHDGRPGQIMLRMLNDLGIPQGFGEFFNRPMELLFWTLIRSDPSERWWKDAFEASGVATSPTASFHTDSGFDGPKVIIYLNDVAAGAGPFEYLPGSHQWRRSASLEIVTKQLEKAHKGAWANKSSQYYRPYMQLPDFRRALMNLPTPARQQSQFGDDVVDGSEAHSFIDQTKRTVLSESADCIAFDGNRLAHRGGLATGGVRWALQVGFAPAPSKSQALVRRGRAVAGSALRRVRST